jgi:type II secretory pathway pseudopilin PulG
MRKWTSGKGISLIETAIALGVLSVAVLGAAAVFTEGMERTKSSPADLIATQKAQEAIESVFAARDSGLDWAQMRNVTGTGLVDGIFLVGPQPINESGQDGIVNTADDGALETITYPGPNLILGDSDDTTVSLEQFTRQIEITDLTPTLRSLTVTVRYTAGGAVRTYSLTARFSVYA